MKNNLITNENPRPFDVDDTLIIHDTYGKEGRKVYIKDPYRPGKECFALVNENMVTILIDEKARGNYIMVWSRGGYRWAEAVVKALELEKYVDLIMTKPVIYYDDKDVSEWLKDRVYLGPDIVYKK
jgi:hypothetical protein